MQKLGIAFGFLATLSLVATVHAAPSADGVKASLLEARQHLLAFLDSADAAAQTQHQAEIAKASKAVDTQLAAAIADKATAADAVAKYKSFKETWEAFKKTRDTEIIPFVKAGKKDDAKALAKGVQAERLKKLQELLTALGAK